MFKKYLNFLKSKTEASNDDWKFFSLSLDLIHGESILVELVHSLLQNTLVDSGFERSKIPCILEEYLGSSQNQATKLQVCQLLSKNICLFGDFIPVVIKSISPHFPLQVAQSVMLSIETLYDIEESCKESYNLACSCNSILLSSHYDARNSKKFIELIVSGFSSSDSSIRKKSTFLLKKVLDFAEKNSFSHDSYGKIPSSQEENEFFWSLKNKSLWKNLWESFFIVFEALEDANLHIVEPVLDSNLSILLCEPARNVKLPYHWWKIVLQKGISNDSVPIRKKTIESFVCLNDSTIASLFHSKDFLFSSLLPLLDNNFLFSEIDFELVTCKFGESVMHFFKVYFNSIPADQRSKEIDSFLSKLLNVDSSICLIFLLESILLLDDCPVIGDENAFILQKLSNHRNFHNSKAKLLLKWILLRVFVKFSDPQRLSASCIAKTLSILLKNYPLVEGKPEFKMIRNWLREKFSNSFVPDNAAVFVAKYFRMDEDNQVVIMNFASQIATFVSFIVDEPLLLKRVFVQLFQSLSQMMKEPKKSLVEKSLSLLSCLEVHLKSVSAGKYSFIESDESFWIEVVEFIESCMTDLRIPTFLDTLQSSEILSEAFKCIALCDTQPLSHYQIIFLNVKNVFETVKCLPDDSFHKQIFKLNNLKLCAFLLEHKRDLDFSLSERAVCNLFEWDLDRPVRLTFEQREEWPLIVSAFQKTKWSVILGFSSLSSSHPINGFNTRVAVEICLNQLETATEMSLLTCMKYLQHLLSIPWPERSVKLVEESIQRVWDSIHTFQPSSRWFNAMIDGFISMAFQPSLLAVPALNDDKNGILKRLFNSIIKCNSKDSIVRLVKRCCETWSLEEGRFSLSLYRPQVLSLIMYGQGFAANDKMSSFLSFSYENKDSKVTSKAPTDNDYLVRVYLNSMFNKFDVESENDILIATTFMKDLLALSCSSDFDTTPRAVFPNSTLHRRKIRCWMTIMVLVPFIRMEDAEEILGLVYDCLCKESMQSTRYYMEWIYSYLLLKYNNPQYLDKLLELISNYNEKSCVTISLMTILIKFCQFSENKHFYLKSLDVLVPWFLSNNFTVRLFSNWIFNFLYNSLQVDGLVSAIHKFSVTSKACQKNLVKFNSIFLLSRFLPLQDLNLHFIFYELPRIGQIDKEPISHISFMNASEEPGTTPFTSNNLIGNHNGWEALFVKPEESAMVQDTPTDCLIEEFQKKINPWEANDDNCVNSRGEDSQISRDDVIVVASLIEKPANLGGLCRILEVMGASTLLVDNIDVRNDKKFQALAVIADKWIKIEQAHATLLEPYLKNLKR